MRRSEIRAMSIEDALAFNPRTTSDVADKWRYVLHRGGRNWFVLCQLFLRDWPPYTPVLRYALDYMHRVECIAHHKVIAYAITEECRRFAGSVWDGEPKLHPFVIYAEALRVITPTAWYVMLTNHLRSELERANGDVEWYVDIVEHRRVVDASPQMPPMPSVRELFGAING